ncbi:hypothetical protein DMB37_03130 [Nocardia sp. CS682]|nr:hypothetical protein DMB37_03130 [Nocardia sp. CS682]
MIFAAAQRRPVFDGTGHRGEGATGATTSGRQWRRCASSNAYPAAETANHIGLFTRRVRVGCEIRALVLGIRPAPGLVDAQW